MMPYHHIYLYQLYYAISTGARKACPHPSFKARATEERDHASKGNGVTGCPTL